MTYRVETGRRYRARIHLGFFERIASDDAVAAKLRDAGFVSVTVTGSGAERVAEGEWGGATKDVELPSQITSVEVLP